MDRDESISQARNRLPYWKKDATEFEVGVTHIEVRGARSYIPKGVIDALDNSEKIKFDIKGKRVQLEPGAARVHN